MDSSCATNGVRLLLGVVQNYFRDSLKNCGTVVAMKRPQASKMHVLRARCDSETKSLAQRAAMILGLDESDIIRMGVRHMAGSLNNTAALLNGTR